jgi:squalene-associated FAD-dependent desaturase
VTSVPGNVHVIGAGLAGLAASVALLEAGRQVLLYEAGPVAGGRCRSYFDRGLSARIDNGNHLLLSGNRAAHTYLNKLSVGHTLAGPGEPCFPFMDLSTHERWSVRPNLGRVPWWIFDRNRRVPGTRRRDYLVLLALRRRLAAGVTVTALLGKSRLWRRLLEPLAIAALNTLPAEASAKLFAAVARESLLAGGAACIPAFPRHGLSESLVDPAIERLQTGGATVSFGRRIGALMIEGGRLAGLGTPDGPIPLGADDLVVLAVPPWVAADLLPGLWAPNAFESILNIHFRVASPIEVAWGSAGFIGLIGGTAEWVFVKSEIVSVTISAANRMVDRPAEEIAAAVWQDVRIACGVAEAMPRWRVIKERRATFAATDEQERRRPGARTPLANLLLAGDWTATGLPATIEGAIRSGNTAAGIILSQS